MPIGFVRAAVVLGLIISSGPFAIDMYLPALPAIANDLAASPGAAQLSLMVYFVSLSVFQLVYGPVSDMIGRRPPLYFGLVLFSAASLGCAFAPNMETLIVLRFFQGIGGCACMVIPRAIVRDLYTGVMATRLMALIMLVFSIGPILAPLIGSVVAEAFGWRAIFVVIMLIGVASIALIRFGLAETRTSEYRIAGGFGSALRSYATLLRDPRFIGISMINGFGLAALFAYIAGASFVYIDHFGLTPIGFSLIFAVNAISFFTVAQFSGRIGARIGLPAMVRKAVLVFAAALISLFLFFLTGGDSIYVLVTLTFIGFGALGLVVPPSTVLALERYGPTAGTASSLIGTVQFGAGAVIIAAISMASALPVLAMTGAMAACAFVSLVMSQIVLRGAERVPAE